MFCGVLEIFVDGAPEGQASGDSPDGGRNAELRILKAAWAPRGFETDLSGRRQVRTEKPFGDDREAWIRGGE
jgi:hypothetical protein